MREIAVKGHRRSRAVWTVAPLLLSPAVVKTQSDTTRDAAHYVDYRSLRGCLRHSGGAAPGDTTCHYVAVTPPAVAKQPAFHYPPNLLDAGVSGETVVEVIVDTAGRPERGSVTIVRTPHPDFTQPIRVLVEGTEFRPALLDGRPVRALVRIPIRVAERGVGAGETPSAELIAQARAQLRGQRLDSALVLLRRVADAPARAPADRVQALVLGGRGNGDD